VIVAGEFPVIVGTELDALIARPCLRRHPDLRLSARPLYGQGTWRATSRRERSSARVTWAVEDCKAGTRLLLAGPGQPEHAAERDDPDDHEGRDGPRYLSGPFRGRRRHGAEPPTIAGPIVAEPARSWPTLKRASTTPPLENT
jgi:hypothetical protein